MKSIKKSDVRPDMVVYFLDNIEGKNKKYPEPLKADDLCDCGKERWNHEGKDGWGPCLSNGCPRFEDSGV